MSHHTQILITFDNKKVEITYDAETKYIWNYFEDKMTVNKQTMYLNTTEQVIYEVENLIYLLNLNQANRASSLQINIPCFPDFSLEISEMSTFLNERGGEILASALGRLASEFAKPLPQSELDIAFDLDDTHKINIFPEDDTVAKNLIDLMNQECKCSYDNDKESVDESSYSSHPSMPGLVRIDTLRVKKYNPSVPQKEIKIRTLNGIRTHSLWD